MSKDTPAEVLRKAARDYLLLPTHRQLGVWRDIGYDKSFNKDISIEENNRRFIKWVSENNKQNEFLIFFGYYQPAEVNKAQEEIFGKLITNHIEKMWGGLEMASVQHFIDTGRVNGSFRLRLIALMKFYEFYLLDHSSPPDAGKEQEAGCGICGGKLVLIRGRYPKEEKRLVCPTCNTERLEQINEISSKTYGQVYKNISND